MCFWKPLVIASALLLSIQGYALADPPTVNPDAVPVVSPERPDTADIQETDLFGRVTDTTGVVIPGVTVTVEGPLRSGAKGAQKSTVTEGRGEFKFRSLLPGKYRVVASMEGMSQVTTTVDVSPARTTSLALILTGPVPEVETRRTKHTPPSEASAQRVLEKELVDEVEAQTWVNSLSAQGERIITVVSLGQARSLFVIQQEKGAAHYTVIRADRTLDATNLCKLLDLYGTRALVGVHVLDKAFLMIFSS